jgi:NADH:ubiquinone oxidoreductase subunit E
MSGLVQRIHDAVHGQTQPTVTVLSSLLAVEDELGYIPKEALEFVAEFSNATINDVWAVASFYPNFRFDSPAEHVVDVCWGASCHLVGAMNIFKSVLEAAGLDDEGDTPDKRLTVRFNSCLGACSQAPVIAMDHHLAGRVNPESAANHVTRLLQQDGHGK